MTAIRSPEIGAARARKRLATAQARLQRLDAMAANPAVMNRLMSENRYLRLAAAIAWASENVERAREAFEEAQKSSGGASSAGARTKVLMM